MIEMQTQVARLYEQAKNGSTIHAVCPSYSRNQLTLSLLAQMQSGDVTHGKSFRVGKGTIHIAQPLYDKPPEGEFAVALITPSEANPNEYKAMLQWRDKAVRVIA